MRDFVFVSRLQTQSNKRELGGTRIRVNSYWYDAEFNRVTKHVQHAKFNRVTKHVEHAEFNNTVTKHV